MKLRQCIAARLLIVSILLLPVYCAGQSASPTPVSERASGPAADASQDKPGNPGSSESQSTAGNVKDPSQEVPAEGEKNKNDRMFYVMPNYLTVDGQSQVKPISWKEKFAIAAKGSFDPYEFTIVGIVAAIRQAEDSSPGFGQGLKGYSKRYGSAFADQVDGNVMVGGVFPTLMKIDPRYFRLGRGSFGTRFGYAISRIFVARKDAGTAMFNVPEFAGNATAIAISNLYYPAADRSASSSLSDWGTQMGLDALGNELKEFWPDVHHYLQRRHARHLQKAMK